jgi:hypothetical protein
MDIEQVLKLDSGWWVRCQTVPPLAIAGIRSNPKYWLPPPPEVQQKTKAGTETMTAPYSSPEYQEYLKELEEKRAAIERDQQHFAYEIGVIEWSQDEKKWVDQPPKGWKCDSRILKVQGLSEGDIEPRTAWIMFYLIRSTKDLNAISDAVFAGEMQTIREGEVGAAEDLFRDNLQGDTPQGTGEGDTDE